MLHQHVFAIDGLYVLPTTYHHWLCLFVSVSLKLYNLF